MILTRGSTAVFYGGFLTAPISVTAEIIDPSNAIVSSGAGVATGDPLTYSYTWSVPVTALLGGPYIIQWGGTDSTGAPLFGAETFSVIAGTTTGAKALTTPYASVPYLTNREFRETPTYLESDDLLTDATTALDDVALANLILSASSMIDGLCNQVLAATLDTEVGVLRPNRQGEMVVKPDCWPVLEVRAFSSGPTVQTMTPLADLSGLFVEDKFFRVTANRVLTSTAGPLQFGSSTPDGQLYCSWSYVHGWANTLLTAAVSASDDSLTVADATGIYPGTKLTIYDGGNQENVSVLAVSGTSVLLASPLLFSHDPTAAEICISALPRAVKEACVLITSALIKDPGNTAVVLEEISAGGPRRVQKADLDLGQDLAMADQLLFNYHRTW